MAASRVCLFRTTVALVLGSLALALVPAPLTAADELSPPGERNKVPTIRVDASVRGKSVSTALLGVNHRWTRNGFGLWDAPHRDAVVGLVNRLLEESGARPYLARHDVWDWHLHVTEPDAPLAHRIAAESAMGFADLVRIDDLARLRHCDAPDCDDVLVDLSRNRSKRYCDSRNCGNRLHVAAYRARRSGS